MTLKLLFCVLSFFSCAYCQGQEATYSAFAINNKEVIWVQVYHASQPADSLTAHVHDFLKRKKWIKNPHLDGADLVADIENFRVDYKRCGGKYMNTSNLIRTGRWSGKTRISVKDGKYRVIVYGLEYDSRQPAMHAGKMSNQPHTIHGTWTDWVLNNYRTRFKERRHLNMDIMHFNLKDGFTLTETDFIDEDW
jgi:hypothetical protein